MRVFVGVSLQLLLCCFFTYAQSPVGFGIISGQVVEAGSTDGLPDAKVTITNESLGFSRTMTTTDDGMFEVTSLSPATGYRIRVSRKGFADFQTTRFNVNVGQTLRFTIEAERAQDSEKKESPEPVNADTLVTVVDSSKLGVTQTATPAQLDYLPSNTRRLTNFALMAPATTQARSNGNLAIAGISNSNVFYLDGVNATNGYFGDTPVTFNQISQDATYEVQTYSIGQPAEFGRAMGGAVNAATRTGSNSIYAAVYGYARIPSMGAASRFALGQNLLQKQNQAGVSVGGPIVPNKLFFFGNVEFLNGDFNGINRITNPLIADSSGTVVSPENCKATATQCAAAIKLIQPQMNVNEAFSERWLSGLGRVDYRLNDKNSIGLEANVMNYRAPYQAETNAVSYNGGLLGIGNSTQNTRLAKATWTSTPYYSLVNDLRVAGVTDRFFDPQSAPGPFGNTAVEVAGVTVGAAQPSPDTVNERRYQIVDNATFSSVTHTIQVGADLSNRIDSVNQLAYPGGLYIYPTLTAFAADLGTVNQRNYTSFTQTFGDPSRELTLKERNYYAQDTWRPTSRITVVGGVRWERYTPAQPTPSPTNFLLTGNIPSPSIDFAPRVGLAFRTNDTTVIRAGYSFNYSPFPGQFYDALYTGNGVLQQTVSIFPLQGNSVIFPKAFTSYGLATGGSTEEYYAEGKLRDPHTQQITLAIEKRLTENTMLTVSLIDSRGYKLWTANDTNFQDPSVSETYNIVNGSGTSTGSYTTQIYTARSDNTHAHVYEIESNGSSWYRAGNIELRKTMSHGISALATYTYSHATTDVAGPLVRNAAPVPYAPALFGDDKGNAPFDQRQRGVFNLIWRPWLDSNFNGMTRALVNGWTVSSIVTLASPQTETPLAIVTGQQFAGGTLLYPSSLNGSGGWGRVPFEGVGTLRTGSQRTVDARIARTFRVTEKLNGTILIEAFNLLNNQFATSVNTIAYTATTGTLKPVDGVGVANAAQGYPQGTNARTVQAGFRVVF